VYAFPRTVVVAVLAALALVGTSACSSTCSTECARLKGCPGWEAVGCENYCSTNEDFHRRAGCLEQWHTLQDCAIDAADVCGDGIVMACRDQVADRVACVDSYCSAHTDAYCPP